MTSPRRGLFRRASIVGAVVAPLLLAVPGCASEVDEETASTTDPITTNVNAIMQRAQEWIDERVPYCGGVYRGNDAICGGACTQPSAAWNRYRTDCSGYVSWCWQIPDVPTTYVYMNDRAGESGWKTVAPNDLQRGDALVCQTHIKLFNRFVDRDHVEIYEEYDCGRVARITTHAITRLGGNTFKLGGDNRIYHGIRRNALTGPIEAQEPPETTVEASQAFVLPNQHHFFTRLANGDLRHSFWDAGADKIFRDTWGTDLAGSPVVLAQGTQQHAWARSKTGALEHWWWRPETNEVEHDTWGTGLAGDPAAMTIDNAQHVWAIDGGGALQHFWWATGMNRIGHDTWGNGVTGRPSVLLDGVIQHAFARGTGGALEHWWWDQGGLKHDTWGRGLAGEPTARYINGQQHVWAVDGGGSLQHWWWDPTARKIFQDTWAANANLTGRPTTMYVSGAQHVFARSKTGALEHWWWDPNGTIHHDTWGTGIAGDPSALLIREQQHVWAVDASGDALHWYWSPPGMKHDNWKQ